MAREDWPSVSARSREGIKGARTPHIALSVTKCYSPSSSPSDHGRVRRMHLPSDAPPIQNQYQLDGVTLVVSPSCIVRPVDLSLTVKIRRRRYSRGNVPTT